jgi:hypothetical protein
LVTFLVFSKAAEYSFLVAIVLLPSILATGDDKLDMEKFDVAEIIQTRERQLNSGRAEAVRNYLVPLIEEMGELGIL